MNSPHCPNPKSANGAPATVCAAPLCYHLSPSRQLLHTDASGGRPPAPGETPDVPPCLLSRQQHSVVGVEKVRRVALMVTPRPEGEFLDQAWEAMSTIRAILRQQGEPMAVTTQTIYMRDVANAGALRRLMEAFFAERMPVTLFLPQPPCDGAELAIEAWAVGTRNSEVHHHGPDVVTVSYDRLRWIHAAATIEEGNGRTGYDQTTEAFTRLRNGLSQAGASFDEVARFWLYQGGITAQEDGTERYRELNRSRTDFFEGTRFCQRLIPSSDGKISYPASTGIGTQGRGLVAACLALQTERKDVHLYPLENPLQTAAFDYAQRFSVKSPKFSRAMAVAIGDYVTTWISGTASIVHSESVHLGDAEKQTEQTLTNIERLIDAENCERHGLAGGGSTLADLAKMRVYVKRPEDFERCRAVCERRLGPVPVIYAHADVCRSELLVEIEAVAFSPLHRSADGKVGTQAGALA
ncbi:MAG: dioxygenase [Chthoniobacteraceae bacterium]